MLMLSVVLSFSFFLLFAIRPFQKTRASCFPGVSKHSKTIKALGPSAPVFISFLVCGNSGKTLALVFEILLPRP